MLLALIICHMSLLANTDYLDFFTFRDSLVLNAPQSYKKYIQFKQIQKIKNKQEEIAKQQALKGKRMSKILNHKENIDLI